MHTYDLEGGKLCDLLPAALRADIRSGALAPGERLPSKRRLAEHHGISVNTVQNAYEQLIAEGYIEARERYGYFVAALPALDRDITSHPVHEPTRHAPTTEPPTGTTDGSRFPFSLWARLMRRVLSEEGEGLLAPLPSTGAPALRNAIATYLMEERGMEVSPAQIVIGAGTEYLYHLLLQLLGKERRYGLENPGHTKIARIYALNGVSFKPVDVDPEGVCVTEKDLADVNALHLSPAHHYPTGAVTSAARRRALLAWAQAGDRYIIEDDYDSEFRFSGRPILPLFSMDAADRVVYINTFSKTIAPSMRISYMVLPQALLSRYHKLLGFYACPVPAFEQYTLARFIAEGHFSTHLRRMRTFYRARRDAVIGMLKSSPFSGHITIKEADAGLHFLVEVKTARSDEELRLLAQKSGIRITFLQDYRIDGLRPDTHTAVLNYAGLEPTALQEGLEKLYSLLQNKRHL